MSDLLITARGVFRTMDGHEIPYRRLVRADIADLPNHWPIVNTAVYYYLTAIRGQGKDLTAEQQAQMTRYEQDLAQLVEASDQTTALICRATDGRFYDHMKIKEPPPGATPIWALSELDQGRFVTEIMFLSSGLSRQAEEAEAQRLVSFRADGPGAARDESLPTSGAEAVRDTGVGKAG